MSTGAASHDSNAPIRSNDSATPRVCAHLARTYLGSSETFIYTLLRFQRSFRPVVMAQRCANLDQFPFEPIHELIAETSFAKRFARRAHSFAGGYRSTYQYRLVRELRRCGCEIVHAHFGWMGAEALASVRKVGLPLVTTFYGRDITESAGFSYGPLFSSGDLFFCEGPHMAEHLERVGCDRRKIRIVKIGLDLSQFPFLPRRRKRSLVLMQTARFVEKKGIDLSIRAFAAARAQLGDAQLWIVGDGDLRPELETLAGALGVSGAVRFLGTVRHTEYRELLPHVDLCIQPSRVSRDGDTEGGAPTVLLEMQATGIPVVATRHADIPSVVPFDDALAEEEDVDGLADRIVAVCLETETEAYARADRGRSYIESEHDARVVGEAIARHYHEALSAYGTVATR